MSSSIILILQLFFSTFYFRHSAVHLRPSYFLWNVEYFKNNLALSYNSCSWDTSIFTVKRRIRKYVHFHEGRTIKEKSYIVLDILFSF